MSIFSKLKSDDLQKAQDRLGGGFQALPSDIYTVTIKAMYVNTSKSGAMGITLLGSVEGQPNEYRETFWVTNKDGLNYFVNKQDNKTKIPLPGFTIVDDICVVCTDAPLADQEPEEKVLNIYDAEAGKEIPKSVQVITSLTGKKVALAIQDELHNKTVKDGDKYVDTAETIERNAVVKVFHPEYKVTVLEATEGREATFWDKWLERYKTGKPVDRRKIKEEGQAGRPPKATPTAASPAPRKSLFGNK